MSATAPAAPAKTAYYVDPAALNLPALILDPPSQVSADARAELATLHQIESTRTPGSAATAKADESQQSIFLYKSVMGNHFSAPELPRTAALSLHVENDVTVVGTILKQSFHRVRPYNADKSLHPVCGLTEAANSYPSGSALTGYIEGLILAEIAPEKRLEILARADDFAHNRLVCGVHYPSDLEAGRRIAYVVFGYMLATPQFQRDLAAARAETRAALGLPPK